MRNKEHNKWFTSIPVRDRERIMCIPYPTCTQVWLDMKRDEREEMIERSGVYRKKGNKFTALGHDF